MGRSSSLVVNLTAFASTSHSVELTVPQTAEHAVFHWSISAVGGTTPIADCKIQGVDPSSGSFVDIDGAAFGQKTGVSYQILSLGPGLPVEATGDYRSANVVLPVKVRALFTFDRADANETYTTTLNVDWIS